MTFLEQDLLSAIKELHETSKAMTCGKVTSADELERFHRALTWSERVIKLAEGGNKV
jgi:hypothetical protein